MTVAKTAKTQSGGEQKSPIPSISFPKSGAIRGMGEEFATNQVTGAGRMTVPIYTSPGRSGFGPQLSLSYDSGFGNGPHGFGWSLLVPAVIRDTGRRLPQYRDAEDSDVFILSGAEDLVPVYRQDPNGTWIAGHPGFRREADGFWVRDPSGRLVVHEDELDGYCVRRYRPRIEGLFARIERWCKIDSPGNVHWRSISRDNILTLYGFDSNSRIADPVDDSRIFSWLICESRDDKGNGIRYLYKREDGVHQLRPGQANPFKQAHQLNRGLASDPRRSAQRYLQRVLYGNIKSLLDAQGQRPRHLSDLATPPTDTNADWLFEVRFDYGELDENDPTGQPEMPWFYRPDAFSSYRSGFEVRTCRRCKRVLMLHHIPDRPTLPDQAFQPGYRGVVRSTDFIYDDELDPSIATKPVYSFLKQVVQTGWKQEGGSTTRRSLPPVELEYTEPVVQDTVEEVDPQSLQHLPMGLDGTEYRWGDLHGEGIPGIFTEQAGALYYMRNWSPIPTKLPDGGESVQARFAPLEVVALKPNVSLTGGAEFMDFSGDGQLDVVVKEGLYEHDEADGWQPFRPFTSRLNCDFRDPNVKLMDLDGDRHMDVFIRKDDAFVWHASLMEEGFGPAQRVALALDEEKGPRVAFADGTQSIYLADLSGDSLNDIVRIRNGEVCYWPNLGYGRFGAKVTMDNAPWFDHPDQFDQKRIRLADIDGSGTTDIIYLHRDGVRLYFNQSGNSWSQPHALRVFPRVDDLASIVPIDLLGNGTVCLVWSSALPGDARRPMRYVNLMGDKKPHLLVSTKNNLGAETRIEYAPSTKFYLQDKRDGKPWITRLPFPVHVVERVTVENYWRKTKFSTTYSYHHGYFDGSENKFGFGRVEQIDVDDYGSFEKGNATSPYITDSKELYQPPVKTVTWFHTGAFLDRRCILSHFEHEYFPHWFKEQRRNENKLLGSFRENILPEPELDAEGLSSEEWREALWACKGMPLRQEIYELDLDALQQGKYRPTKLFTAAYHNCCIHRLQPKADNQYAVFLVAESEAVTYHYELDLRTPTVSPDPRVAHALNLQYDEYANVLQTVAVVYPRQGKLEDDPRQAEGITESIPLIHQLQEELHLAYTETRYTDDFGSRPEDKDLSRDNHRLRIPCEILSFELTGIHPEDANDLASPDPRDNLYFTLDELRRFRLSPVHQLSGEPVTDLAYHQQPDRNKAQKRLVEHVRMLFFKDDESILEKPFPLGQLGRLGLPFETYKLALTNELLDSVFVDDTGNSLLDLPAGNTGITARQKLDEATISGYLSGQPLEDRFSEADPARFTRINTADQYWIRSGIAGFEQDAVQHFYLPERYIDPFGNGTTLEYDDLDLFIKSSTDHLSNRTEVTAFDYRVLAPAEIKDLNDNYTAMAFDVLGLPVGSAVMGKDRTESGDSLSNLRSELTIEEVSEFLTKPYNVTVPSGWLDTATARFVYDLGEVLDNGKITYCHRPASACSIMREKHVNQLQGEKKEIQVALEYSDGIGAVLVKKAQAEPAEGSSALRWIAIGKTILNNKGKPVKQYEPYFSETDHRFDPTEAEREVGVTPIMYYDAVGRLIRTELPDGSFSRVEFSPWHVASYDPNDTVAESQWYVERGSPKPEDSMPADAEARAAWLAVQHADTPSMTILDSLGREVVAIAHNRIKDPSGIHDFGGKKYKDVKYLTFTKLDAEGKPLWIRDARGNLVMQYITPGKLTKAASEPDQNNLEAIPVSSVPCYDLAGNLLFQHSMDAGDRWMIMDAAGKPMLAWDINETAQGNAFSRELRIHATDYDALHRPNAQWLVINAEPPVMAERYEYQDAQPNDRNNLNGQIVRHYDPSGMIETARRDFKGNVLEVQRTLNNQPELSVIDWQTNPTAFLDGETYIQITEYDALNRMTRLFNWHRDVTIVAGGTELQTPGETNSVAIYEPTYNERGLLVAECLHLRAEKNTYSDGRAVPDVTGARSHQAIKQITYNERGQKVSLGLGNGTLTQYEYDDKTFRLKQIQTTRPSDPSGFPQRRSNLSNQRIVQQLLYTYDPVGNITEVEDQAYMPVFFQNAIVKPRSLYEYDALYRLTIAKGREKGALTGPPTHLEGVAPNITFPVADPKALREYTQTYCYDSVGNIMQMHHQAGHGSWTRDYAYAFDDPNQSASNRLWQTWTGGDRTQSTTYGYDAHGNMLNLANTDPRFHLQWDHRDMIREIDLGGGGTVYYQYEAGKQRTRKRIVKNGMGYWERIYLGGLEIYREYIGGELVKRVESIHLVDGEQRLLLVEDVNRFGNNRPETDLLLRYQYSNHLGSAVLELNEQAKIISFEEYHPYGTSAYRAMNADITAEAKRNRYTGKERDEESGLYYYGARFSMPWIGRWASFDPDTGNLPWSPYCFCKCTPISKVDQFGLAAGDTILTRSDLVMTNEHTLPKSVYKAKAVDPHNLTPYTARDNSFKGIKPEGPRPKIGPISLKDAKAQGPQAFSKASQEMMKGSYGDTAESKAVWDKAATKTRGTGKVTYPTAAKNFNKLHLTDTSPEMQLLKEAYKEANIRIDPSTGERLIDMKPSARAVMWEEALKGKTAPPANMSPKVASAFNRLKAQSVSSAIAESPTASLAEPTVTATRVGVGAKVMKGLGTAAAVGGSLAGGIQVGTGFNKMLNGNVGEGAVDVGEGSANLGLSIGTAAAVKAGLLTSEVGLAAGVATTGAGLAAAGSIMLLAETARAAIKGEETPIDVADKFYGTHFGDIYGWVTGAYSK